MGKRRAISAGRRFEVMARDGYTCVYCGARGHGVVLHVDHRHPVAAGGDDHRGNLVTACAECNLGKSDRILDTHPPVTYPAARMMAELIPEAEAEHMAPVLLALVAGYLDAAYMLDAEAEARALAVCTDVDMEPGAIAAALPDDPLLVARIGLAVFAMVGRMDDPVAGILIDRWLARIAAAREATE